MLVVAATQCMSGAVNLETYEVGRKLLDLGVVSAGDMTTEAVVTKMAYLFGRKLSGERLRKAMNDDLRGERTVGLQGSWGELSSLGGFAGAMQGGGRRWSSVSSRGAGVRSEKKEKVVVVIMSMHNKGFNKSATRHTCTHVAAPCGVAESWASDERGTNSGRISHTRLITGRTRGLHSRL